MSHEHVIKHCKKLWSCYGGCISATVSAGAYFKLTGNIVWHAMNNPNLWSYYTDGVKTDVTGDDGIIFWAGTGHHLQGYNGAKFQELYDGSQSWRLLYLGQNEL